LELIVLEYLAMNPDRSDATVFEVIEDYKKQKIKDIISLEKQMDLAYFRVLYKLE
jgi:hypothetical protein